MGTSYIAIRIIAHVEEGREDAGVNQQRSSSAVQIVGVYYLLATFCAQLHRTLRGSRADGALIGRRLLSPHAGQIVDQLLLSLLSRKMAHDVPPVRIIHRISSGR